jgi:hypothetical protein
MFGNDLLNLTWLPSYNLHIFPYMSCLKDGHMSESGIGKVIPEEEKRPQS